MRGSKLDAFRDIVGKLPDREVAEKAGVTRALVHAYRKKHGIPSVGALPPEAAPKSERKVPARSRSSKLEALIDKMGVMSDAQVAKLAGVTRAAVRAYRTRRNIAASSPRGGRPKSAAATPAPKRSARAGRSKIDAVADLVGKMTDGEVGKRVGVSAGAVRLYRVARGIEPAVPQGHHASPGAAPQAPSGEPSEPAAAPASRGRGRKAARSPAVGGGRWAWRLGIADGKGEIVRFVLAGDALAACSIGEQLGEVRSLERLGEAVG